MSWLTETFPPLYTCSVCGLAVSVTPKGAGIEPTITRACAHSDAVVYANRKATVYGKGEVNVITKGARRFKLTLRQFLSALTGRSI